MKSFQDYLPPKGAANRRAHQNAISYPTSGHERAIRDLFAGLELYVNASVLAHGDAVDGVLSPGLGGIVEGLRELLNGDLGRFDGGTLSSFLDDIGWQVGWCSDHEQMFWDCDKETCERALRWTKERP